MVNFPTPNLSLYGFGQAPNPANVISTTGAPSTNTTELPLGTLAVDNAAAVIYALVSLAGGTATWTSLGGGTSQVSTLTGDSGTATPLAGNIQIAGGSGISTSASGHVLTVTALGAGFTWNQVNSTIPTNPVPMAIENGYITTDGSVRVTLKLPATAPFGSTIKVLGRGTAGWEVIANTGQIIELQSSTTSVAGNIQSGLGTDSIELVCTDSNTVWTAAGPAGNITFA